ncbi:vomeronasal type-2 receptor 26-like [Engystomops pustulosus]|uniref:vomeronasal type-2 receptor 26-like n=1 Tax=Engystomops pustulosus TaxID=76066 RepID=UPI003AFB154F
MESKKLLVGKFLKASCKSAQVSGGHGPQFEHRVGSMFGNLGILGSVGSCVMQGTDGLAWDWNISRAKGGFRVLGMYSTRKISYGSTDPSLSDRLLYPHVFRTIQSSHMHIMVIIEMLKYFGWTWVGILVSDDDDGEKELQILTKYMRENGICAAYTIKLREDDPKYDPNNAITNPQVRIIIMCGTSTVNAMVFLFVYTSEILNKTLIFPPSWASGSIIVGNQYSIFNGSLGVDFSSPPFPGIDDLIKNYKKLPNIYLDDLHWTFPVEREANQDLVSVRHGTPWANSSYMVTQPSMRYYIKSGVSPRLYEAVEILAKSLHEMFLHIKDKYKENPITGLVQYTGKLQRYIQRMKNSRDPMSPSYYFTDQGEALHPYKIINWIFIEEPRYRDMKIAEVGNFTTWPVSGEKLYINPQAIMWGGTKETDYLSTHQGYVSSIRLLLNPVSRCSDPCLPGSRKKPRETIHTCCYDCVPCSEGEISNITDAENCIKCESDEWPNEGRDRCLPKVTEFISYQNDPMASVFSGLSLFGCLVTGFIFTIFIFYRDTPIVKANNRNLSYLLLVSIFLSFLSVFLFLGRPSDVTCRLRETSFGVFFSVAVSSLLAKTVMVCVAFKSTKPGSPWRRWLSVKLSYTIVLLCSSIQVVICVIWLSISPPFQDLDTQSSPGKIIIQCNEGSDICFYSMLGYMGLLAAGSFLLAFMVRTLPDSFNEAKYITFSMLLFCSVWISMIPAYLSTRGKYMVAVEIFAVMASSAGLLGCVFFPKCFIILFRSEMNRKTDLLGRRKE